MTNINDLVLRMPPAPDPARRGGEPEIPQISSGKQTAARPLMRSPRQNKMLRAPWLIKIPRHDDRAVIVHQPGAPPLNQRKRVWVPHPSPFSGEGWKTTVLPGRLQYKMLPPCPKVLCASRNRAASISSRSVPIAGSRCRANPRHTRSSSAYLKRYSGGTMISTCITS